MRIPHSLLLGAALIVPQLGGAQLPIPTEAFAKFEAVLDFCAKANPKDSESYEKMRKKLVEDAPGNDVSEARTTQEYKDAYQQARSEFSKMPKENATKACSASLGDSK